MNLQTAEYRHRYLRQCIDLMGDTWNFNGLFPGIRRENLVNELFFREAVLGANYSELVVDEGGAVHGYLFGRIRKAEGKRAVPFFRRIQTYLWALGGFIAGHFGPRLQALSRVRELLTMTETLDARRRPEDAYVCLFLVASSLRGMGWGKRLMDSFERKAAAHGCGRIYLWTDAGCNYGFYDHMGFERIEALSSPLLTRGGAGPNGFVYVKAVDGEPAGES